MLDPHEILHPCCLGNFPGERAVTDQQYGRAKRESDVDNSARVRRLRSLPQPGHKTSRRFARLVDLVRLLWKSPQDRIFGLVHTRSDREMPYQCRELPADDGKLSRLGDHLPPQPVKFDGLIVRLGLIRFLGRHSRASAEGNMHARAVSCPECPESCPTSDCRFPFRINVAPAFVPLSQCSEPREAPDCEDC